VGAVSFKLTSASVEQLLHPKGNVKVYTCGMTTRLSLQADRQGNYDGLSSHFSGDGFSGMRFTVHALPPQEFAAWAQGARGKRPTLDGNSYVELAKPSSYVKPIIYGGVAPDLFEAIATNRAPAPSAPPNQPSPGTGT
jgi:cytochrome o ubiquinol oxidase subunit 2